MLSWIYSYFDNDIITPSSKNDIKRVRSIISRSNANQVNEHGTSALMWCCQEGYLELAELLIQYGADINLINKYGYSALYLATRNEIFVSCYLNKIMLTLTFEIKKDLTHFHGSSDLIISKWHAIYWTPVKLM